NVKVVARKELPVKTGREESSEHQRQGRDSENSPAMIDGKRHRPFVRLPESTLAWLIGRLVAFRLQDVIRQQREECHRHHPRCNEGARDGYRQAVDIPPDIAT